MQKNGENQPLSSEIIADLEEKLMTRNVIIAILAAALAVTISRRKWGQNEKGGKDNGRNTFWNRIASSDIYSIMVPDDNGYFKYSVFNVSYSYNSVSSYVNKNGGKINEKIKQSKIIR